MPLESREEGERKFTEALSTMSELLVEIHVKTDKLELRIAEIKREGLGNCSLGEMSPQTTAIQLLTQLAQNTYDGFLLLHTLHMLHEHTDQLGLFELSTLTQQQLELEAQMAIVRTALDGMHKIRKARSASNIPKVDGPEEAGWLDDMIKRYHKK